MLNTKLFLAKTVTNPNDRLTINSMLHTSNA